MAGSRIVVVFGGAGFLGSAVCRRAVLSGARVVSVSRSGCPGTASASQAWVRAANMEWRSGDCLDPSSFQDLVDEVTAAKAGGQHVSVVHAVGALLENQNYKHLLEPLRPTHMTDAWSSSDGSAPSDGEVDYDSINRDTLLSVAGAFNAGAATAQVSGSIPLAFVSAFATPPLVGTRYISSKREAEEFLFDCEYLRPLVYRPGFMYSEERPWSMSVAGVLSITSQTPLETPLNTLFSAVRDFVPEQISMDPAFAFHAPVRTDIVADSIMHGLLDEGTAGVLEDSDITELAHSPPPLLL